MTSPSGQIMRQFGQMENEIMLSLLENVFSIYCVQGCWVIVIREDLIYVALGYWMSEQSGWRSFYLKIWRDSLRVSDFVVVVWWTTGLWKLQKELNQTTSEKEVEMHNKVGAVSDCFWWNNVHVPLQKFLHSSGQISDTDVYRYALN